MLPNPDAANSTLWSFVHGVERSIEVQKTHWQRHNLYCWYFEQLGGQVVQSLSFLNEGHAFGRTYSSLTGTGYFDPVLGGQELRVHTITEYPLTEILALHPDYPEFWASTAQDGIVPYKVISQDDIEPSSTPVFIESGEDIEFPNAFINVTYKHARISFMWRRPALLLYPHILTGDTYVFTEIPPVLDRVWRVYTNICETRKKPLFHDLDPSHTRYKSRDIMDKITLEYSFDDLNRIRPVDPHRK